LSVTCLAFKAPGGTDFGGKMPYIKGTITQRIREQFVRVQKMVREGDVKTPEACRHVGISYSRYKKLRTQFRREENGKTEETTPNTTGGMHSVLD
jgi:hypothetical protein